MELEAEVKKLVDYIKLIGLQIPARKPPSRHVGAVIADAVLQIGHEYERQVRKPIVRLREEYPEAATISGFLHLLETTGAQELLDGWKGIKEHRRLHDHARFFAGRGIETFEELAAWLQDEKNRDILITAGLGMRDRTADYYRVLVGLPDAVKVDSRVEKFLGDAGIDIRKYEYKELRTMVQLAAKQLGKRPIDLDGAIWNYQGKIGDKGGDMTGRIRKAAGVHTAWVEQAREFSLGKGLTSEVAIIDDMDWPAGWDLPKGGNGGKPHWWFRQAILGNYKLMWEYKDSGRPSECPDVSRFDRGLCAYIRTPAGSAWLTRNCPPWIKPPKPPLGESSTPVAPPPPPITISLPSEQKAHLEKLAVEWEIDAPALARIWILERLGQLH